MTAPGGHEGRGLGEEPGCLLVECERSLNDEHGTRATLRVVEVPTLGGTAAGDVELATSCVTACSSLVQAYCSHRLLTLVRAHACCCTVASACSLT